MAAVRRRLLATRRRTERQLVLGSLQHSACQSPEIRFCEKIQLDAPEEESTLLPGTIWVEVDALDRGLLEVHSADRVSRAGGYHLRRGLVRVGGRVRLEHARSNGQLGR